MDKVWRFPSSKWFYNPGPTAAATELATHTSTSHAPQAINLCRRLEQMIGGIEVKVQFASSMSSSCCHFNASEYCHVPSRHRVRDTAREQDADLLA